MATKAKAVKEQEGKAPVLPEELRDNLVFMREGYVYDTEGYYHATADNLLETIDEYLDSDDGEVMVYKLVPYAVVEPVPSTFRIKE